MNEDPKIADYAEFVVKMMDDRLGSENYHEMWHDLMEEIAESTAIYFSGFPDSRENREVLKAAPQIAEALYGGHPDLAFFNTASATVLRALRETAPVPNSNHSIGYVLTCHDESVTVADRVLLSQKAITSVQQQIARQLPLPSYSCREFAKPPV